MPGVQHTILKEDVKGDAIAYVAAVNGMKLTVLLSFDTIFLFISASKHLFALAWLSSGPLTNW